MSLLKNRGDSILAADTCQMNAGSTRDFNVLSNDIGREYLTVASWTLNGVTYSAGQTFVRNVTVPPSGTPGGWDYNPGSLDHYSIRLSTDGTLHVVSEQNVNVDWTITYTTSDNRDGSQLSTTARLVIGPASAWGYGGSYDGGGDGPSSSPGGDSPSAGDANGGDGGNGVGAGDGSGSGGGTGTA